MKCNKNFLSSIIPHRASHPTSFASEYLLDLLPRNRQRRASMQTTTLVFSWVLVTSLIAMVPSGRAFAQSAFHFPASVPVGGSPSAQSVSVTIQSGGTVGTVEVLTQGSPNLDFTSSGGGTCASGFYAGGQTCSLSVGFAPRYPGVRLGAVVILADDGHVMASQGLFGVGTGSLSVMAPGEISTLAGDGCLSDGACSTGGSTQATTEALNLPMGETTDGAGNVYISDTGNNRIRKVDPAGNITTIAGSSEVPGYAGDGGSAAVAQINGPSAILVDGAGNVFFADTGNNAVREIDAATGIISTVAGTHGTAGFGGDGGAATSALLNAPLGLAFDADNNLYIADTGNNRIRKVDASGTITTVVGNGTAGFGGDGGDARLSELNQPWGLTISIDGNLYIADLGNNRIRAVNMATGSISTVVGTGTASYFGDGGSALSANLNSPAGVAADAADNLYIADSENNVIRKVNHATGIISTAVGTGTAAFGGDGTNATKANLYIPYSVSIDDQGDVLIADRLNLRIRKVSGALASLKFPTMKEGKTSAPIYQAVENDGNAPLHFVDLKASPGTMYATLDMNPDDPITTPCSTSQNLAIDSSCELAVEFTPISVGDPETGVLSVTTDSGNSPLAVNLSGNVLSVDPSSSSVTSSLNPAAVGMAITFVAHISSPNQVTGTVQFYDGATPIGVPQAVDPHSNTATITTSFSVLQSHSITAVYSGDDYNAASTPNSPLTEIIEQATSLNVIPSANPVVVFAPLTFDAALTGWTTPPTGSITFMDGATSLGSAPLNGSGAASFAVPPLAVGRHTITATFAGDANDFTSQYTFVQTVNLAPSSTALGTSSAVAQFSAPITLIATVTGVSSSTPTGNVDFKDGTTVLATSPLNALGMATYVNSTLSAGTHTITAAYKGDADYSSSVSTQIITETISQTATATTLSTSATSSISGRPVTLSASVTAPGGTVPTGTVDFVNGNLVLGTVTISGGTASLTVSNLSVGTDNIAAIYSGDANDTSSKSPAIAITVRQAPTITTVSSSQSPIQTLTPVTISAMVSNGGSQNPTGLVTFSEDGTSIGVGSLNPNGVATISLPSLIAGNHTFAAAYAGDALDIPSVSAPFSQTVQQRPTTDVLTTSTTSLSGGQQLTLISVVRPAGSAPSTGPGGNVTFMSGDITLATAPVDATGVATVTVVLSGTSATISSTYAGDANYSSSSSEPTQVSIGPAPDFHVDATPTSWHMQSKQHLTIKLTLTSVKNFSGTFSLGCLGLPQGATCTFSQDKPALAAGGSQTVNVTVDTGSPLLSGSQARNESEPRTGGILTCILPGCFALGFMFLRVRRLRLFGSLLLVITLLGVSTGLSGCGSIQNNGTPPGTYHFLITATTSTGVSQSVNMTLTITE